LDPIDRALAQTGWADYHFPGGAGLVLPSWFLAPHANSGGQDSATGTEPIIPSAAGTTSLGTTGVAYAGTPNVDFANIVTALVLRNVIETLRDEAIFMQEGSFMRAQHVPGTNVFRYTAFADLGPAETLLEGIPPVSEKLAWDVFEFSGGQKGKIVAISDLAELFSPFDLYRTAAEKIAWNAVDTAEKDVAALVQGSDKGVAVTTTASQAAQNIVAATVAMKQADVPTFPDGTYHAIISPADAALIMTQTGELGWTDTAKYANGRALLNGELGTFRGVRFIESNRVADHKTVLYGPQFCAWGDYQTIQAYRVAPGGDHADPLAQRGLVGWKGMWGLTLVGFDGTPAMGPASNAEGARWAQVDLTKTT
jgi:N4-gp56 family major capsid protein